MALLSVGSCTILVMTFAFSETKTLKRNSEAFLDAVEAEDYATAYAMTGDKWHAKDSLEQFSTFFSQVRAITGKMKDRTMTGLHTGPGPDGFVSVVGYRIEYDTALVTVKLSDVNGVWKIQGTHFNSPRLNAMRLCPECRTRVEPEDEVCEKCGAFIKSEAESTK